jgi:hypothetical protein
MAAVAMLFLNEGIAHSSALWSLTDQHHAHIPIQLERNLVQVPEAIGFTDKSPAISVGIYTENFAVFC